MKKNLLAIFSVMLVFLLFVFAADAQTDNKSDKDEKKNEQQVKDKPLTITKKSPISRNVVEKCYKKTGNIGFSIRLRATFHSSGEITNVEIIGTSGCEHFDDDAIKVAKKIKFKPAVKNGELVTVTKIVEYKTDIR